MALSSSALPSCANGSAADPERLERWPPDADPYALTRLPEVSIETHGREFRTTYLDRAALRTRNSLTLPLVPHAWLRLRRERAYGLVWKSSHALAREFVGSERSLIATSAMSIRPFGMPGSVKSTLGWPADIEFYSPARREPAGSLFAYGRFVKYKHFDLAIEVAENLGMPLHIAGNGPLAATTRRQSAAAAVPILVHVQPSDDDLLSLLEGAMALVFPGIEDFGICARRGTSCGRPRDESSSPSIWAPPT